MRTIRNNYAVQEKHQQHVPISVIVNFHVQLQFIFRACYIILDLLKSSSAEPAETSPVKYINNCT